MISWMILHKYSSVQLAESLQILCLLFNILNSKLLHISVPSCSRTILKTILEQKFQTPHLPDLLLVDIAPKLMKKSPKTATRY